MKVRRMMIIFTLVFTLLFVPNQVQSNHTENEPSYSHQPPSLRGTTDHKVSEYGEIFTVVLFFEYCLLTTSPVSFEVLWEDIMCQHCTISYQAESMLSFFTSYSYSSDNLR